MLRSSHCVLALVLIGSGVFGQEETAKAQEAAPEEVRAPLVAALVKLQGGFSATGKTARTEPSNPFGGAVISFGAGGGQAGRPFEGPIDVWCDEQGTTVITSDRELPGFGVLMQDKREIARATFEKDPLGLKDLRDDLRGLLNASKLVLWAEKGKVKSMAPRDEGTLEFRCVVTEPSMPGADEADGAGNPFLNMRPRILRLEMDFVVMEEAGTLRSAKLSVVRSDPMAAFRRQMESGGGEVRLGSEDLRDVEPEDGAISTYELALTKAPSERTKTFRKEASPLLKK